MSDQNSRIAAGREQAAERLLTAESDRVVCAPVRDLLGTTDIALAYSVQLLVRAQHERDGRRLVGRKIGLTATSVQKQLGVDQPDFGGIYADTVFATGEEVPFDRLLQPRVEAEVAFVINRDLTEPDLAFHELLPAIEYMLPALEIVDSRIADWDISLVDTVSDNASSGLVVLGTTPRPLGDLYNKGMAMTSNGEEVSLGNTVACLGNPLLAVLWLARQLASMGDPLREGELVMSGALGPMALVEHGASYLAQIEDVGDVRVHFGQRE
jgi:2-keto-4-pentenoate hydratase